MEPRRTSPASPLVSTAILAAAMVAAPAVSTADDAVGLVGQTSPSPSSPSAATLPDTLDLETLRNVIDSPWFRLSPDGSRLAYQRPDLGTAGNSLWVLPTAGGEPVQITRGGVRSPAGWSPAGRRLAFVGTGEQGPEIQVVEVGGEGTDGATADDAAGAGATGFVAGCPVPAGARDLAWLADGQRLAYVAAFTETETVAAPDARRARDDDGQRPAPRVSSDRPDGDAVFVCRLTDRTTRRVTSRPYFGLGFAWSPTDERLVITAQADPGFYGALESDLWLVDGTSGNATPLVDRPGVDRAPSWSPDGRSVAFVSGFGRSGLLPNLGVSVIDVPAGATSEGARARDVGQPRDVGQAHDRGGFFEGPLLSGWSPDSRWIYYTAVDGVRTPLFRVSTAGGEVERMSDGWEGGDVMAHGYTLAADGPTVAFERSSLQRTPDIYVADLEGGPARQLTRHGVDLAASGVPVTEVVRWTASDGMEVEGLLLRPSGAAVAAGPYPMITILHGGPASAYTLQYPGLFFFNPYLDPLLAARDYAVFMPNPRGSGGYGEAFRRAAQGDWGDGPTDDVLSGIDALVERGVADPERLGLMGWSYGGYLTAWMLTQTDRFAVASVGAGVTDLVSHYGQSASQMEEYFEGSPWERPALYRRQSPVAFADRIRTPTLILHGTDDTAVSPAQAELLFAALQEEGVPSELVRYPGQGHTIRDPAFQDDAWERLLGWVERWIDEGPPGDGVSGTRTEGTTARPGEPTTAARQDSWEADVQTIDSIIEAYYDVISGPAGEAPDEERDAFLHHPDALVAITGAGEDGTPFIRTMSLDGYYDGFGGPRSNPFYEWEINREVLRFGNVAHVWSTYVTSTEPEGEGEPFARGINSIQLYDDGERWWILGWVFDSERAGNEIPERFLP